ncbi:hypothetical protein F53441_12094 [Fusarium austroafricanum]|uniref:USP domain-containing protein n=1 Tax=Fusarium austroafricanum TaxID=2364996 RepID=A0A8H4JZS3_9HYPO|nr:hypothetical protein F53441_12094 [Fusarium austroafricanum]
MDPALRSPALPDRAFSAEASSTRPNPFDDGDTSRKRQRTSLSGSPTNSLNTLNPIHDSSSSTTLDTEPALLRFDSVPADSLSDPVALKTPDSGPPVCDPSTEPPSSMATLNLRNAPENDSSSSPPSPSSVAQPAAAEDATAALNDHVKKSVEDSEVEMVPAPTQSVDIPQSSLSHSPSPPIEVITVQSDDDMASDQQSVGVSIVDNDSIMIDPIHEFPFKEPSETMEGMVMRLSSFLENHSSVESEIIYKLQHWLEQYLEYTRNVDQQSVTDSCRLNIAFWVAFPHIVTAMTNHKPPLYEEEELGQATKAFFSSFTRLSAWFVSQDILTMKGLTAEPGAQSQQFPELFSPSYLQHLHSITQPQFLGDNQYRQAESASSYFVKVYQDSAGGSISRLLQLTRGLVDLIPTHPRLTNELTSILQVASDIMTDACHMRIPDHASKSKQKLEIGYTLYELAYVSLDAIIDKKPTYLIADNVLGSVQALSEMIKAGLRGEYPAATRLLQEYREAFPTVPSSYTAETIACERRFHIFIKLIRSSQMQLRFQGMTQMCRELIACWKRHTECADDGSLYHVEHLAEHLIRTGFIDYLLGASCHPEITVEGANILGFIIVTKKYRKMHIDMLWEGITSRQDPRMADALTRMVNHIAHLFDDQGLLILCEKFQALPVDAFTPVIRILWEGVMKFMAERSSIEHPVSVHPYNLCLRLMRESSAYASGSQVMYPEMQQAAMQKFRDLLRCGPDSEGRRQLYLGCLEDIASKSSTTLGSIWCLYMTIRSKNMGPELRFLAEEHDLTRLIVEEFEHAIKTGQATETRPALSYTINQPRREFISLLIQLEPLTITQELGVKLWDMLVGPLSLSPGDRRAGWEILTNLHRRNNIGNPFLRTCLTHYLPTLSSEYFCEGMLEFLRIEILPRLNEKFNLALDDPEAVAESGIEQLWRLVLEAEDDALVDRALRTLAVDVYIDNRFFNSNSPQRARSIHLVLVSRCLEQLKNAATKLRSFSQDTTSDNDDAMATAITHQQLQQQKRMFTRSLKFLRYILEAHQSKPHLSAPDLRTLIPQAAYEVRGDSAGLKYQSFDGNQQTDIKPLVIGKGNTAASLLASLQQETGFENYRVYYRGRPFLPTEQDICKSLEDLRVHDGLILVRREEAGPALSNRVRPGASPLEIEISAHFDEMREYLGMDEALAQEIYFFLIKLPTDGHFLRSVDNEAVRYKDIFPSGQPFKSLYAVHALVEYTEAPLPGHITSRDDPSDSSSGSGPSFVPSSKALRTAMSLVMQAISDENIFDRASMFLRLKLTCALLHAFRQFLDKIDIPRGSASSKNLAIPQPARLVKILSYAVDCPSEMPSAAIAGTLIICLRLSMLNDKFWVDLSTNSEFTSILHRLLLADPRQAIRSLSAKLVEELFAVMDHATPTGEPDCETSIRSCEGPLAKYFWAVVGNLIQQTTNFPNQCEEFFKLAHFLLVRINARAPEELNMVVFACQISQLLLQHTTTELLDSLVVRCRRSTRKGLVVAIAPMPTAGQFCRVLRNTPGRPCNVAVLEALVPYEMPTAWAALIFALVRHDHEKTMAVAKALSEQVPFYADDEAGPDDHYIYDLTYHFERHKALRAPCGYVGLLNLSNTCYLNSLMVQLYMNTGFRRFILNCRIRDPANSQQLLSYTQKLFGHMQESYLRFIDTSKFVNSIRTYDDTLIDIHNQMDVDEFYNLLIDRWETQLLDHDEKREMKSFYGGQLVQQVKSKECEHISERLEPFSAIQCDIKGKSSLAESLQAYVDGEVMEGDNKYKCSTCDRHVDAVKRACLKDIPDNLIFHLKRFDFNLRTLQRSKINDYFSFPDRVDMRPYTIEHLSNPEDDVEDDIFELVGVLVHSGTAESGHYYSYIRERPSSANRPSWVEFNDDMVAPWDPAHMEYSTFGGPDHRPLYDTNGILYDKNYSAYMLFYQRASSLRAEQEEMIGLGIPAPLRVEVPDDLQDHILDENTNYLRRHCVYDPSNANLVLLLFQHSQQHCETNRGVDNDQSITTFMARFHQEHGLQDLAMQALIGNLDQVVTRVKDIPDFGSYSTTILSAVTSCQDCAFSFYDYFNQHPSALRMLLLRNPDPFVRNTVSKIFIHAVMKISESLPNVYNPQIIDNSGGSGLGVHVPYRSVIDGVMMLFNRLWEFFHSHIKAWDDYFGTILSFAQMGHHETGYVLAADFLTRAIIIISADPLQDFGGSWARVLQNVIRRNNSTRPPSYLSLIALTYHLISWMEPHMGPDYIDEDSTDRLSQQGEAFNWTSEEVTLIYNGLNGSHTSLFVEKLLALDQSPLHSDKIIQFIVRLDQLMDQRVLATLKHCISGETSTLAMDPFLRAAITYIESTEQLRNAKEMVQHIFLQANSLQNTEGLYFIRFFATALNLKQQDEGFSNAIRLFSLDLVPKWVPYLLRCPELTVRTNTETFLNRTLLDVLDEATPVDGDDALRDRDNIKQTTKRVGLVCLEYLRDVHVRKRVLMSREIANKFLHVIRQCAAAAVNTASDTQSELDSDFLALQDGAFD